MLLNTKNLAQIMTSGACMSDRKNSLANEVSRSIDTKLVIQCILCDNTLELSFNESVPFPYVCKDCKDAIAYVKYLQTHLEFK